MFFSCKQVVKNSFLRLKSLILLDNDEYNDVVIIYLYSIFIVNVILQKEITLSILNIL